MGFFNMVHRKVQILANKLWLASTMSFEFFVNSLTVSLGRWPAHCHAIIMATWHCIPNSKSIGCHVIAWKFHSLLWMNRM